MLHLKNKGFENKKVFIALQTVYGIGLRYSEYLCSKIGVSKKAIMKNVSIDSLKKLIKLTNSECSLERELEVSVSTDIATKIKLKTYQGKRHSQGLPVRGQNTKNNSQTSKKLRKVEGKNKVKK